MNEMTHDVGIVMMFLGVIVDQQWIYSSSYVPEYGNIYEGLLP